MDLKDFFLDIWDRIVDLFYDLTDWVTPFWKRFTRHSGKSFRRLQGRFEELPARTKIIGGSIAGLVLLGVVLVVVLVGPKDKPAAEGESIRLASASTEFGAEEGQSYPVGDQQGQVEIVPESTLAPVSTPRPTPAATPNPILKRGMDSEEVKKLQETLMDLGYLDIDESTSHFGPATEDALKRFQRQVNFSDWLDVELEEDGVAGVQTLSILYSDDAPKYILKFGMEGDDITAMQRQLKGLGYMSATTGYFGEKTVEALKDFQDRNHLSVDGLAGSKTSDLLYSPEARESATKAKQARTKANIETMISVAKKQLGKPYVLGAEGPSKFDCSGLVYYCLSQAGSNRNRMNAAGYSRVSDWEKIEKMGDLKRGDLIFFYSNDYSKVGHVGIVLSSSEMIDASSSNGKVVRRSYTSSYWKKHFVCGRRPW